MDPGPILVYACQQLTNVNEIENWMNLQTKQAMLSMQNVQNMQNMQNMQKKNENVNDMTYTQTFAKFANHTYQIKLTNPYLPNEID